MGKGDRERRKERVLTLMYYPTLFYSSFFLLGARYLGAVGRPPRKNKWKIPPFRDLHRIPDLHFTFGGERR